MGGMNIRDWGANFSLDNLEAAHRKIAELGVTEFYFEWSWIMETEYALVFENLRTRLELATLVRVRDLSERERGMFTMFTGLKPKNLMIFEHRVSVGFYKPAPTPEGEKKIAWWRER